MTVPAGTDSLTLLNQRLDVLREERAKVLSEATLEASGDVADRATNVEALIRLQLLDERIALLELEIADSRLRPHPQGIVSLGDVVTLDLGDGDETYLVGPVEHAYAGVDTITPMSPLGKAILGAEVGSTVEYQPRPGKSMKAVIRAAGQALPESA
jgi:transcription elongation factor GreA